MGKRYVASENVRILHGRPQETIWETYIKLIWISCLVCECVE